MTRRRGRSLFWTIAGLFLAVLALGTLLQLLVADPVLRPLEARDARARAEIVLASLAPALAALPPGTPPDTLDAVLARARLGLGPRPARLYYRAPDGALLGVAPSRARFEPTAFDSARGAAAGGAAAPKLETLAHREVARGGQVLGQLTVVRPERPRGEPAFFVTGTWLLFFPIAALTSVIAGLVLVRWLVHRLRGVETLAARVSAGDLSVRIGDTSGDEIGRIATRLDAMTERLSQAHEQLLATERQRRQLFADITHELATPLTSIRGYAETLLDPRVPISDDDRTRYVRGVVEESRRLDRLIRDLFELARLEAGAVPLQRERLDWAELCHNTLERFTPRFRDAGLMLRWSGPTRDVWVDADGHRLVQVLENLLANALRYVPTGGTVTLAIAAAAGGGSRLTVDDDGPGVPAEELPMMFERFYRGGGSRDDGGSGLGLAIVREIVDRHGGRVSAAARAPHGLTITVELPAA